MIHVTVATIVQRIDKSENRFLMVEENIDGQRVINQPAGHVEAGESLTQAALRETLEETGWQVELQGYAGVALYTAPSNGVTYCRHTFVAMPERQIHQHYDEGIIGPVWMTMAELQGAENLRSPLVLTSVEHVLAGNNYPLTALYGDAA